MKRFFLPFVLLFGTMLAVNTAAQAQNEAADIFTPATDKKIYVNAGIGIGAYTAGGLPIGASVEVDVFENISLGGFLDYSRYTYNWGYNYKWNYNFLYFGARGSYHLSDALEDLELNTSKLDPYAGLSLGYRSAWYSDNYSDNNEYRNYSNPYSGGVFLGVHLGTRYMFSDNFGAFAEVGYGVSALRLGATARF